MRLRHGIGVLAIGLIVVGCGTTQQSVSPSSAATATPTPQTATETPTQAPSPISLKVMTFNIEYGGNEVDFARIVEAVTKAGPDVVGVQEAEGNTAKLAEALGWPYYSGRTQIISKLPIIDPAGADGAYVFIEASPGRIVAMGNVHLPSDPYGPYYVRDGKTAEQVLELERTTRLAALQPQLVTLPALAMSGVPVFLTGDFNSPSHLDWTPAAVGLRSHVKYALDWPVSQALAAAGLKDSYRAIHPDPITDPGLTWWAGRPLVDGYPDPSEPQDRIDIVYSGGPATATATDIVGEPGRADVAITVKPWGTDHRGVISTFSVSPVLPPPFVAAGSRLIAPGDSLTVTYGGIEPGTGGIAVVKAGGDPATASIATAATVPGPGPVATVEISSAGWSPGAYEVVGIEPTTRAAIRSSFWVGEPAKGPTLTTVKTRYAKGEPILLSWANAPGNRWDWIGVYAAGDDPLSDSYLEYIYTRTTIAGSGSIDAAAEGDWPLPPGKYEAHYLVDDGYVSLARVGFTVTK